MNRTMTAVLVLACGGVPAVAWPATQAEAGTADHGQRLAQARAMATSDDPGTREAGIALYDGMLAKSPGNADALLGRGLAYAWMKRYEESERDLKAVTAASPGYADAWAALGNMYMWSGRPGEAIPAYTRWMELRTDDPEAALARGRANRAAGNADAARVDFAAAGARGASSEDIARLQDGLRPAMPAFPDQLADGQYEWALRAGIDHTAFSGGRAAWNDAEVSLRRRFRKGSIALEWLTADRFDRRNSAWALDAYASLWPRAYANFRYQQGGGILPQQAWRAELFQGVGRGWELSASIDRLRFNSSKEFYGVGVGRYVGNWYWRYKLQHVPGEASGSWSHRALVRNYYRGNADDYWELSAGNGRSTDLDRFGGVSRSTSASFGAAWMHYFRPNAGLRLSAGLSDNSDGFGERRVGLTFYTRW